MMPLVDALRWNMAVVDAAARVLETVLRDRRQLEGVFGP